MTYKPGSDGNRKLLVDTMMTETREPEAIKRREVPGYFTEEIKGIISAYIKTKNYGLPYGNGWAKQPCVAMDIISCLDSEMAIIRQNRKEDGSR